MVRSHGRVYNALKTHMLRMVGIVAQIYQAYNV